MVEALQEKRRSKYLWVIHIFIFGAGVVTGYNLKTIRTNQEYEQALVNGTEAIKRADTARNEIYQRFVDQQQLLREAQELNRKQNETIARLLRERDN